MKRTLSLVLAIAMIISMMATGLVSQAASFSDIGSHWAKSEIEYMVDNGVLNGYPNGTFKPEAPVTKAEFIKMMNFTFGLPVSSNNGSNAWYYQNFQTAAAYGYLTSSANPDAALTRQEAAQLLANYLGLTATRSFSFNDSSKISSVYASAVYACREAGIFQGDNYGNFNPTNGITRAEASTVLKRIVGTFANNSAATVNASNAAITKSNVSMYGAVISGDLLITEGAENGVTTLYNTTVYGTVKLKGAATLKLINSTIGTLETKTDGSVSYITATGTSVVRNTNLNSPANITNETTSDAYGFNVINTATAAGTDNYLSGAFKTVNVNSANTDLNVAKNSVIEELNINTGASNTDVDGDGYAKQLNVSAAGAVIETAPKAYKIANNLTATIAGKTVRGTGASNATYPMIYVNGNRSLEIKNVDTMSGTTYYKVVAATASAPTASQIMNTSYSTINSASEVSVNTGALSAGNYNLYYVSRYNNGSTSAVGYKSFTVPAYVPVVSNVAVTDYATYRTVNVSASNASAAYVVALPATITNVTASQVYEAAIGTGVYASYPHSTVALYANSGSANLTNAANYTVYVVAANNTTGAIVLSNVATKGMAATSMKPVISGSDGKANGQIGADASIIATYSVPLYDGVVALAGKTSATYATLGNLFSLKDAKGASVAATVTVSLDGKVVTIDPLAALTIGGVYTLVVDANSATNVPAAGEIVMIKGNGTPSVPSNTSITIKVEDFKGNVPMGANNTFDVYAGDVKISLTSTSTLQYALLNADEEITDLTQWINYTSIADGYIKDLVDAGTDRIVAVRYPVGTDEKGETTYEVVKYTLSNTAGSAPVVKVVDGNGKALAVVTDKDGNKVYIADSNDTYVYIDINADGAAIKNAGGDWEIKYNLVDKYVAKAVGTGFSVATAKYTYSVDVAGTQSPVQTIKVVSMPKITPVVKVNGATVAPEKDTLIYKVTLSELLRLNVSGVSEDNRVALKGIMGIDASEIWVQINNGAAAKVESGNVYLKDILTPAPSTEVQVGETKSGTVTYWYVKEGITSAKQTAKVIIEVPAVAEVNGVRFSSIQAAIDAAAGQTVKVLCDITEKITLEANSTAVIDGNGKSVTKGMTLTGSGNVTLTNFKFSGFGLYVSNAGNVTITKNTFNNITGSTSGLADHEDAIFVNGAASVTISENVIDNTAECGIDCEVVSGNIVIDKNTVKNVLRNALQTNSNGSSTITVTNNTLQNWGKDGYAGRAYRAASNGSAVIVFNENVMIHAAAPEEFVKLTGNKDQNVQKNYWNGADPTKKVNVYCYYYILNTEVEGTIVPYGNIGNFYKDAAKTQLVTLVANAE